MRPRRSDWCAWQAFLIGLVVVRCEIAAYYLQLQFSDEWSGKDVARLVGLN